MVVLTVFVIAICLGLQIAVVLQIRRMAVGAASDFRQIIGKLNLMLDALDKILYQQDVK